MFLRSETPARLTGVEACRDFFADCMAGSAGVNGLWVAHVDGQARCIQLAAYPAGAVDGDLPVQKIIEQAAQLSSVGMVVAEHRTGDAPDVPAARAGLRQLSLAAEAMDVAVLDHLIFTGGECTSLRRAGLL
ncbi:hypothetical protein OMW55_10740 [Sphingomonas sp. BN140010]|uniref:RadC-like JAB domain-containing protein n=1 Tax=Sphingomonas arvum TaxID=2992113 RepID=A0ABT3JGR1_9SPHN|nr:JAB domain-containing protein [Sphingomonas sp. BN140010]MCW3798278.1 hypothetical protein [Sphingomonas sp. BN140010]